MGTELLENNSDINLEYLSSEILTIRWMVQRWFEYCLKPGKASLDRFQGLYISDQEAQELAELAAPGEKAAGEGPTSLANSLKKSADKSRQILEIAGERGERLRLVQLRETFRLTDFEYAAFLICLLPALDLRYERIFAYLQDDVTRKQASVDLILSILGQPAVDLARLQPVAAFSAEGTLLAYRLLRPAGPGAESAWQEPRLNQVFEVPPAIVAWLCGDYFPEERWLRKVAWEQLPEAVEDQAFAQSFELDWKRVLDHLPILAMDGADPDRQELAARKIAYQVEAPLLAVDLAEACAEERLHLPLLRLMIRDACLLDAVLFIRGWDHALDEHGQLLAEIAGELAEYTGVVIVASAAPWRFSRRGGRAVMPIHIDPPSSAERAALWEQTLCLGEVIPAETLRCLASQFTLTSGQILDAAFAVRNQLTLSDRPAVAEDLFAAARQQSSHHLEALAQKIEPRYSWGDIVLPETAIRTLRDIVATMRYRSLVLEEWGLGKKLAANQGLSALFTGDPGTGKTLAAQVVAAELQLDLYRIDLSNVVSKFIGETEKNLEKIFQEAHSSNAILFFDEADAIFGKRSEVKDAHDRYANIEVGYLLQRMETHDGVTILATNLGANLDEAFTRRLNYVVHFPFPDAAQRLSIWQVLLPPGLPLAGEVDWEYLAHKFDLAGGNIRNALVSAAYLAAQDGGTVQMAHLLQAVRREMLKMGRLIKDEEFSRAPQIRGG